MRHLNHFTRCPRLLRGVLLLVLGLVLVSPLQAQGKKGKGPGKGKGDFGSGGEPSLKSSPSFLALFREPIAKAAQSTVRIRTEGKDVALGVVVSSDGWVLTRKTDVEGKITVKLRDGRELDGRLVGVHDDNDLAMIKIDATGLTPVIWKESKVAPVGYWVAAVGMGTDPVGVGVVSVAARKIPRPKIKPPPPNSGFLGIGLAEIEDGAVVGDVQPKSAAEKAGLKINDRILFVDQKAIPTKEVLIQTIQTYKVNDTVTLKIKRGEEELEVQAKLGQRPPSRADFQNSMGSKLSNRRDWFDTVLQHDGVVLPEDCGGPLCDLDGNVIGINISRAGRVKTFAVPAEVIQPLLRDLMSGRLAPPEVKASQK